MTALTTQQMRELANEWQQQLHDAAMTQSEKDKRERTVAAFRTAADQLEAVQVLSDSWKREGVAPDFWIELNRALRTSATAPQAHGCDVCGKPRTHVSTPGGIRFCDEHRSRR